MGQFVKSTSHYSKTEETILEIRIPDVAFREYQFDEVPYFGELDPSCGIHLAGPGLWTDEPVQL